MPIKLVENDCHLFQVCTPSKDITIMLKTAISEILGTFIIVIIGTASIIINDMSGGAVTHFGICICWGVAVFLAIYLCEKIAEGHFNPAVSTVLAITSGTTTPIYILRVVSQLSGAILASVILSLIFPMHPSLGGTLPKLDHWKVFIIEVTISFALMTTVFFVQSKGEKLSVFNVALIIGLYVFVAAYITGPYTGASMNPARTLGPAIVSGYAPSVWLYMITAPIGMFLAVPMKKVFKK